MKHLILLLTAFTYAQNQPITLSPERVEIIYDGLQKGEMCKDDLDAANELISTLSGIIDNLNRSIQYNVNYMQALTNENDRLAKENYGLINSVATDKAKLKYDKKWAVSVQAGYGIGLYNSQMVVLPAVTVGISRKIFMF